ncbi:Clan CD, family C13, asparaginyl endopeptidase-like cysteine peptidase [Histomonas meleagridis]|uniref:Clan CD, family C13, asparaginyl endopeptidase-like cysteine peptidase n=1 Tax=Histomonas meleagridis TaxID=135588 RepID=UPI00355A895E|nr:Clan CD, family C13, asparaginyl endopeptidase-like cysteine peptidase [Histomonas meleagridis]KAH0800095.1 Clan CD, family C13, asparaginyl endopeptidase-like cysteine peptidase [Histomonas meleagridis]
MKIWPDLMPMNLISIFVLAVSCDNWAVILTGTKGWDEYRHSADAFYQYHLLIKNGFDKNKIILMNYDDIALSPKNMYPGQVFHNLNHSINIYPGSENIPYRGKNVTSQNIYNVLLGDTSNGPALLSNESDNVYIFYTGYYSIYCLTLPDDYLYFIDLEKTIQQMSSNNRFRHLFFFTSVNAFSSGLKPIPNVYVLVTTNGNPVFPDPSLGNIHLSGESSLTMATFIERHPDGTFKDMLEYFDFYGIKFNELGDSSMKSMKISEFFYGQNLMNHGLYNALKKIFESDEMESMDEYVPSKNMSCYKSAVSELRNCKKFLSNEEYKELNQLAFKIKYVKGKKIAEEIAKLC